VGDRIVAQTGTRSDRTEDHGSSMRSHSSSLQRFDGSNQLPKAGTGRESSHEPFSSIGRLLAYLLVFCLGYLLPNLLSAWEHQRFVESVLASNGFVAVLRLGLADELNGLRGDLAAMVRPLESIATSVGKPEEQLSEIRAQLVSAARRAAAIK